MAVLWMSAVLSFGAGVLVLVAAVAACYALVGYLHAQITQALGRQISIESGTALRTQLREWTRMRLRVLMFLAALAGALFAIAIGAVVAQLFGQ